MVDKKQIRRLLKDNFAWNGTVSIDDNGLVSCTGSVSMRKKLRVLPVKFSHVDGNFFCQYNELTTLEGSPATVGGDFFCNTSRNLTTLKGAPKRVDGQFRCDYSPITTLEGAPTYVGRGFWCYGTRITTLEHSPATVVGDFWCYGALLETLRGAPTSVSGDFCCNNNQLTSLEHAPTSVGKNFWCNNNQLTSLAHAPASVGAAFQCENNPLETLEGLPEKITSLKISYSPNLPLLRALGAQSIQFDPPLRDPTLGEILSRYAGQGEAGAFPCGAELATAGYKENARW